MAVCQSLIKMHKQKIVGQRQTYRRVSKGVKAFFDEIQQFTTVQETDGELSNINISNITVNNNDDDDNDNIDNDVTLQILENSYPEEIVNNFPSEISSNNNRDSINSPEILNLSEELRNWATTKHVSHSALSSLLHVLSPYHPQLPLDSRTLLKTPKYLNIKKLDNGEYCYIGLLCNLKHKLIRCLYPYSKFKISFNVDGLPLYNSSNIQLWPILGTIKNYPCDPFAIGIFCGSSKPAPLSSFLEEFINELCDLLKNGFEFQNKMYEVEVHSFVCDAPARAFLKCIKNHNGYSACEKCVEPGEYINGRVILKNISAPERTDELFLLQSDEDHHTGVSPLVKISVGLVSHFPIDYMHNVCLGVTRKLLNSWISGNLKVRLKSHSIKVISEKLLSLKDYMPIEFNRKPRSLNELQRWKATEFRTFLLYLGPLVLRNVLDVAVYEHFLLLHTGIAILISPRHILNIGCDVANKLLRTFVTHAEKIYDPEFLIYNVHLLCHLSRDVEYFGALDNFSAFIFENYLRRLKGLIHGFTKPLQQLLKRLDELNSSVINKSSSLSPEFSYEYEHNLGPLLSSLSLINCKQFKKVIFHDFTFLIYAYSTPNSYFLSKQNVVVQIHNIVISKEGTKLLGKKFASYEPLYYYPFSSRCLQISIVSNLSQVLGTWSTDDVIAKCLVLPFETEKYVALPLLHS